MFYSKMLLFYSGCEKQLQPQTSKATVSELVLIKAWILYYAMHSTMHPGVHIRQAPEVLI